MRVRLNPAGGAIGPGEHARNASGERGEPVEVRTERAGETAVIRPMGDVDMSGSPELRAKIRTAQGDSPRRLVVDLSEVGYMDSSGLATLVEAMKNAKNSGSELVLASMGEKVRAIFEIARLDAYFTIVGSVDEATR